MKSSFKNAFCGLFQHLKSERNMRIHLAFAFYVLIACAVTRADPWEWTVCVICVSAVIATEIFNTALERLCDFLHPGRSDVIKTVKDAAAGSVLIMAIGSAVVGGIVFFNRTKLDAVLSFIMDNKALTAAILVTVPMVVYLVFRGYKNDKKDG